MIVYRFSKKKYADDLSGKGAELSGGRWNKKGSSMLYTSVSRALCTAEIAVHTPMGIIPTDYFLITINIESEVKIGQLDVDKLPKDWKKFPHSEETQVIGEEFLLSKELLVLKVPSAVVQGDFNYLINPLHKDFHKISIIEKEFFSFDKRLFK